MPAYTSRAPACSACACPRHHPARPARRPAPRLQGPGPRLHQRRVHPPSELGPPAERPCPRCAHQQPLEHSAPSTASPKIVDRVPGRRLPGSPRQVPVHSRLHPLTAGGYPLQYPRGPRSHPAGPRRAGRPAPGNTATTSAPESKAPSGRPPTSPATSAAPAPRPGQDPPGTQRRRRSGQPDTAGRLVDRQAPRPDPHHPPSAPPPRRRGMTEISQQGPNGHTFPLPGHLTRLPCPARSRDRRACGRDPASATPASAMAPPASSTGPGTCPSQTSEMRIAAAGTRYKLVVTRPTHPSGPWRRPTARTRSPTAPGPGRHRRADRPTARVRQRPQQRPRPGRDEHRPGPHRVRGHLERGVPRSNGFCAVWKIPWSTTPRPARSAPTPRTPARALRRLNHARSPPSRPAPPRSRPTTAAPAARPGTSPRAGWRRPGAVATSRLAVPAGTTQLPGVEQQLVPGHPGQPAQRDQRRGPRRPRPAHAGNGAASASATDAMTSRATASPAGPGPRSASRDGRERASPQQHRPPGSKLRLHKNPACPRQRFKGPVKKTPKNAKLYFMLDIRRCASCTRSAFLVGDRSRHRARLLRARRLNSSAPAGARRSGCGSPSRPAAASS